MVQETNYIKGFNWREFIKIVGGISFAGAGLAVITMFKDKVLWGMVLGFILMGIGFALMVVDWGG